MKLIIRENAWPVNATIRSQLWPELCAQHQTNKDPLSLTYWESVNTVSCPDVIANMMSLTSLFNHNPQTFGTTELPDKPIMLPPFVDSTHCLPYHLTKKGRAVADRIVSVLYNDNPDITYSPTLYPICAVLLHFMTGEMGFMEIPNLLLWFTAKRWNLIMMLWVMTKRPHQVILSQRKWHFLDLLN